MSTFGTHTISNLKSATGIADDRLSAHHPNGTGNETAKSEFITSKVGMPYGPQPDNWKGEIELVSVPACLGPGNRFTVRTYADVDLPGIPAQPSVTDTHYGQQILKRLVSNSLSVTNAARKSLTVGRSSNIEGNRVVYIDAEYEVTGYGVSDVDITLNDPYNGTAGNMGAQMPLSQDDTSGTSIPEVTSQNQIDLLTDQPKWDQLIVTFESDPVGENIQYSATVQLHDPNDKITDTNRRYELEEIEDGSTRVKEDTTNGLSDQETFGSALIATSQSAIDNNDISTFEFRVKRVSNTSTTVHFVRFEVEWHDMTTGEDAIVNWNECAGENVYQSQNGYAQSIQETTL
jgi:hypothetical protein